MKLSKMKSTMKQNLFLLGLLVSSYQGFSQNYNIILGRPTDSAVTASVMFDQTATFYLEYGSQSGTYGKNSATYNAKAYTPDEVDMTGLLPNSKWYYRLQYKLGNAATYTASPEYSFYTQKSKGSSFTFTIEADEHLYDKKGVKNMYNVTLANEAADKPDFMLSLGDIFGDDHTPNSTTSNDMDLLHRDYRPFLGSICHSIPFYICLGNHEGESDFYYNKNTPNNICVWGTQWRKHYYPNPSPNNFYTGNTTSEPYGIGNPENYYAWTWGDALFVVLDVYREECHDSLSAKPQNWNWTLGDKQYNWLKNTLESNTSKYKFVFAHHIRGQGRGGILEAQLFEWGGLQKLGGPSTFAANRPGWAKPIHQLFKDNGVNIFFQGHDHVFAHETLDGITYQSVPMAADSTYEIGMLANADSYVSDTVDGTGHIKVSVSESCVQVDYIKAYLPADTVGGKHKNREIGFSYTIGTCKNNTNVLQPIQTEIVRVFPNPASEKIYINSSEGVLCKTVSLLNAAGQLVAVSQQKEMDISQMPNGVYFVQIATTQSNQTFKLIISH